MPALSIYQEPRNQHIWDEVSRSYQMSIVYHDSPQHHMYYGNGRATFYVPFGAPSVPSVTHELLHLYLDVKGFNLSGLIVSFGSGSSVLRELLPKDLFEHICNNVDHSLMLPLYLNMGYNRALFVRLS